MNINKLFSSHGRTIKICSSTGVITTEKKCFIQPLRYKNKMYLEGTPTEIGINNSGYYLMLAPADFPIEKVNESNYITDGITDYHVDRSEKLYFGEKVYFIWAVLRQRFPDKYPVYNHFA